MLKEVLYTTALDESGNLIHISQAQKGISYYCPVCKMEYILRKSGKTGRGSRRPHFAHDETTPNCTPEKVLHYSFIKMLKNLLERKIAANLPITVSWNCNSCSYKNSANLLEKVTCLKEEYTLERCRPDIALFDDKENAIIVIEIVVTHKPEEQTLQYYKEKKIVLIQINLTSDEDIKQVEERITHPDIVDFCFNTICRNSAGYAINRRVRFRPEKCGICFYPIEKYFVQMDSSLGKKEILDFTEDEINLVKLNRARIEIKTDSMTGRTYPLYICPNCQRIRSKYNRRRL